MNFFISLSAAVLSLIIKFLTALIYFYLNSGKVVLREFLMKVVHIYSSNLVTERLTLVSEDMISTLARAVLKSSLSTSLFKTS